MSKCYGKSGIFCGTFSDSNSVSCSFINLSFSDNYAITYTYILLDSGGTEYEIKSRNILMKKIYFTYCFVYFLKLKKSVKSTNISYRHKSLFGRS